MDILFSRPMVIALAILGAVASTLSTTVQARIGPARAKQLNRAGYACMGASMLLFIIAGFRS
jgi:type II secretory pathway pseudopilin PulG